MSDDKKLFELSNNKQKFEESAVIKMGKAKEVECRVQFINFGTVDLINEVFRSQVIIKSKWRENSGKIQQYDPKKNWNPLLYIENGQTISTVNWIELITYDLIQHPDYTEVVERRDITGDFWERMELQDFPLDVQSLSVTVVSSLGPEAVKVIPDKEKISSIHPRAFYCFHEQQKYNLHSMVNISTVASYVEKSDYERPNTSSFQAGAVITRKSNFYLVNNFLIVFIISVLSLTLYSEVPSAISSRLSAIFTLLLTLFAFKIVTSSQLPTISYLTIVDKYQVMNMTYLSVLCVWFAILNALDLTDTETREYDIISLYVFVSILTIMNCIATFWIIRSFMKMSKIKKQEIEYKDMIAKIHNYDYRIYDY